MPKRYGSRGTILTSGHTKHKSQTGSGSSSRRTSYGDPLSKKWENRTMRRGGGRADNIDAVRKSYVMHTLGITTQGRMDRLKLALTNPYRSTEINFVDRPTYMDKVEQHWEERRKNRKEN
jgi:hypothetical protein